MPNIFNNFLKKAKIDAKFKMAGSGHRLDEAGASSSASVPNSSNTSNTAKPDRKDLSTKKAAEAAIERIQRQQTVSNKTNTLENILREEKQKISEEYKMKEKVESLVKEEEKLEKKFEEFDLNQRFCCPTIGLSEGVVIDELNQLIKDYIETNFSEDRVILSVQMIANCNYSLNDDYKQRIDECIKTLEKIVTNLGNSSPENLDKFKRIRKSKIDKRVLQLRGGLEFLRAIGFEVDSDGEWLEFKSDSIDLTEQMSFYRDVLNSAEQFPIELDRQCVVYDTNSTQSEDLTNDFFKLSSDELKKEMESLTQKRELEETLRTKAMREQKHKKFNSKFTRLRFKNSDGQQIEATFRTSETLCDVKNWLLKGLESITQFDLKCVRDVFTDQQMDKTLFELNLVPTATLFIISKDN